MGGNSSTPDHTSLFNEPWRQINWGDRQNALQYVNDYKPYIKDQQLRILLHGAVGAGKSSFINSVNSVLRGQMCTEALADNISGDSFTTEYSTYRIQKGSPDTFYPFIINDIMGLSTDKGVRVQDIILAFKGHMKHGYKFNPQSTLSEEDQFYNKDPNANNKVYVLVCVVAADTVSTMSEEIVAQIRDIRLEARQLGIPQVALLTKVDMTCPEINEDLRNVYRSKYLKEKMEQFSASVGIPMNCIFPVKNYHEEINLNDDVDSLILNALKHIIDFGEDYINRKMVNVETD